MKSFFKGIGIFSLGCFAFILWYAMPPMFFLILIILGLLVLRRLYQRVRPKLYFASRRFRCYSSSRSGRFAEYDQLARYINKNIRELPDLGLYGVDSSDITSELKDALPYRPRYLHVRSIPQQEMSRVTVDPVYSLLKYFEIEVSKQTYEDLRRLALHLYRIEMFINKAQVYREHILKDLRPPALILKRHADKFWEQLGSQNIPESVPYAVYKLKSVTASGGEGVARFIALDQIVIEELLRYIELHGNLRGSGYFISSHAESIYRQILERDGFMCRGPECRIQYVGVPTWSLDVVHIVPPSRGGITDWSNLVTLCWDCRISWESKSLT